MYKRLTVLNREDPPNNTNAFYNIQNLYINLNLLLQNKIKIINNLQKLSKRQFDNFILKIKDGVKKLKKKKEYVCIDLVNNIKDVKKGFIYIKDNLKTNKSILNKSKRPSILKVNPKLGIEHIRDCYRFKIVVEDLLDAIMSIYLIHKFLFEYGISNENTLKFDINKLFKPKEWGWRFIAFDFRFESGLIVECYITFKPLELIKKEINHQIFEKWRNYDIFNLTGVTKSSFIVESKESSFRYRTAFVKLIRNSNYYKLLFLLFINFGLPTIEESIA